MWIYLVLIMQENNHWLSELLRIIFCIIAVVCEDRLFYFVAIKRKLSPSYVYIIMKVCDSAFVINNKKTKIFGSVCLSACLPLCLFDCLSVCLSHCLSVFLSVCLSVYVCFPVCVLLFVCLSVWICLSALVCLSLCLPVCVCLFVCLSVCLFVCLLCLFVCLFVDIFVFWYRGCLSDLHWLRYGCSNHRVK